MIQQIYQALLEWIKTFSNEPSFLSSKRIERFSVFTVMLVASAFYLFKGVYNWEIDSTELMLVVGGWLTYAGFNVIQGKSDKKEGGQNEGQ